MRLQISEGRELFEERAAILEYDAGWPRPIAESEAFRHIVHLRWRRGEFQIATWLTRRQETLTWTVPDEAMAQSKLTPPSSQVWALPFVPQRGCTVSVPYPARLPVSGPIRGQEDPSTKRSRRHPKLPSPGCSEGAAPMQDVRDPGELLGNLRSRVALEQDSRGGGAPRTPHSPN
jgi:hypothetical protein